MIIEKKVLDALGVTHYDEIKKFYSRRNNVYLIRGKRTDGNEIEFIYKAYVAGDIDREYGYLQRLKELPVPAVMARGDKSLALRYIAGKTMLERLEEAESSGGPFESNIDGLIDLLNRFYSAIPGHIYGDVNLRNFIVMDEGVYGVDFEEVDKGEIYTDIGRAAAFLLTYYPSYTDYKKKISDYLVEKSSELFGFKKDFAQESMKSELKAMQIRRNKKDNIINNDSDIL